MEPASPRRHYRYDNMAPEVWTVAIHMSSTVEMNATIRSIIHSA